MSSRNNNDSENENSLNSNSNHNNISDWQPSASESSYSSQTLSENENKNDKKIFYNSNNYNNIDENTSNFDNLNAKYKAASNNKKIKFLTGWHFFFSKFYENFKHGITEYDYGSQILNNRLQEDVFGSDSENALKMGFKELVKILGNIWRTIPKKELSHYYAQGAKHKKKWEQEREKKGFLFENENENLDSEQIKENAQKILFDGEENFDLGSIPIDKNLYQLMVKEKKQRMTYKKQKKKIYNKNYKKNRKNKFLDELENGNYDISYLEALKAKSIKFSGIPFNLFTKDFFNQKIFANMFSKENYEALSELSLQYQKKEISTNNVMKVISKIWKTIPESEKEVYKGKSMNEKRLLEEKYDKKIREKLAKQAYMGKEGGSKGFNMAFKSRGVERKRLGLGKRKEISSLFSSEEEEEVRVGKGGRDKNEEDDSQISDYQIGKYAFEDFKFDNTVAESDNRNNNDNGKDIGKKKKFNFESYYDEVADGNEFGRKAKNKQQVNFFESAFSGFKDNCHNNSDNYPNNLFATKTTNSNSTDNKTNSASSPAVGNNSLGNAKSNDFKNNNSQIKIEVEEDEFFFKSNNNINHINNIFNNPNQDLKLLNSKKRLLRNSRNINNKNNDTESFDKFKIKSELEINSSTEAFNSKNTKANHELNFKHRRLNNSKLASPKASFNNLFLLEDDMDFDLLIDKKSEKEKEKIFFESSADLEKDEKVFYFSTSKIKYELVVRKVLNRSLIFTLKPFPYLQAYCERFNFSALLLNDLFSRCENISQVYELVIELIKENFFEISYNRSDNSYEIYAKRLGDELQPTEPDFRLEAEFQSRENLNDIMYDYISRLNDCDKEIKDLKSK